jgi:hypothetical protein
MPSAAHPDSAFFLMGSARRAGKNRWRWAGGSPSPGEPTASVRLSECPERAHVGRQLDQQPTEYLTLTEF